jgi:hypothetical protein
MTRILITAIALFLISTVIADAGKRGETCWRTNRATGQHFRTC